MLLDRLDPEHAIVPASRQDDADGIFAAVLRERRKENVDRTPLVTWRLHFTKLKAPLPDRQDRIGRQDVDLVRLDLLAILRGNDGHRGVPRENFGEHAFAVRREMGDDDKRHSRFGRHVLEKAFERAKAAGGGADANDRELRSRDHRDGLIGSFPFRKGRRGKIRIDPDLPPACWFVIAGNAAASLIDDMAWRPPFPAGASHAQSLAK